MTDSTDSGTIEFAERESLSHRSGMAIRTPVLGRVTVRAVSVSSSRGKLRSERS